MDELYLEYYSASIGIASKLTRLLIVLIVKNAQNKRRNLEIYNYTKKCMQNNGVNICINEVNTQNKERKYSAKRV